MSAFVGVGFSTVASYRVKLAANCWSTRSNEDSRGVREIKPQRLSLGLFVRVAKYAGPYSSVPD